MPGAFFRTVEAQPSGVRLAFRTAATVIELDVLTTALTFAEGRPDTYGTVDLVIDGALLFHATVSSGGVRRYDFGIDATTLHPGEPATVRFVRLPNTDKLVELWLPHDVEVELRELRTNAEVHPPPPDEKERWVHYGSSISHGAGAAHPTGIWPAVAAGAASLSLQNLGFSGSALLEPFAAQAIRDTPADLISLELGINVVNHNAYGARMFVPLVHGFLDTIREGHPTTPIWVISPLLCPIVEVDPGPTGFAPDGGSVVAFGTAEDLRAGRLNLPAIRELLADIVAERAKEDPFVHYLDGRELYGENESRAMPLPDGLHPGPDAHRHIGERFAAVLVASRPN